MEFSTNSWKQCQHMLLRLNTNCFPKVTSSNNQRWNKCATTTGINACYFFNLAHSYFLLHDYVFKLLTSFRAGIGTKIFQVHNRTHLMTKWFSRITNSFRETCLVGAESYHTHHDVCCYTKPIHTTIPRHEFFLHISPSKHIGHPHDEVYLPFPYPSWLCTCLSF